MGTGNYKHPDGETVILDLDAGLPDETPDDPDLARILMDEAFCEMRASLKAALSGTAFWMEGDTWRGRDELVLARNRLYAIWSVEDSYGHLFLTYGLRDDIDEALRPMALANLGAFAARVFDRLQADVTLRVATSPWTSAPRDLSTSVACAA